MTRREPIAPHRKAASPLALFFALILPACLATSATAADVLTVGSVTASGTTVDVPVYIRDLAGTPLGVDQPSGSRIQSLSIKVSYAPASAVSSVTFSRAGITAGLTPSFEQSIPASGSISLLATFSEGTNPIPFTLGTSAPGNLVAHLVFTLSAAATPDSTIALTLDPSLTQLTNTAGSTKETDANGQLSLVDGAIQIPELSISLSPSQRSVTAGASTTFTATTNFAVASNLSLAVTTSNAAVAAVAPTTVLAGGSKKATIDVTAGVAGSATITVALPQSAGGDSASVSVNVSEPPPSCTKPAAPQIAGPASVTTGIPFQITWAAVAGATAYAVEEAAAANFTGAVTSSLAGSPATFTLASPGTRYYRVRAFNRSGSCDTPSNYSATLTVTATAPETPARRIFAIVGSTAGGFGAHFRTSLQLSNPRAETISGRLLFHPAGASASPDDPSLAYAVPGHATLWYADLLPAMGVESGTGSLDLVAELGSPVPVSLMRVYNDAGASGTSGLTQEALDPADALQAGTAGVLIAPNDMTRFRLNIGVRSLEGGASLAIEVHTREGSLAHSVSRTLAPDYFVQTGSAEFLDGYALQGGESITIRVVSGSAIIYGATTDNTTNDPSQQFAPRVDL